jgi:hypothetical protein
MRILCLVDDAVLQSEKGGNAPESESRGHHQGVIRSFAPAVTIESQIEKGIPMTARRMCELG